MAKQDTPTSIFPQRTTIRQLSTNKNYSERAQEPTSETPATQFGGLWRMRIISQKGKEEQASTAQGQEETRQLERAPLPRKGTAERATSFLSLWQHCTKNPDSTLPPSEAHRAWNGKKSRRHQYHSCSGSHHTSQ